ncbi:MAG: TetR/AcrR family transcriptional regulator [Pseudomonadota bacterium]
MPRAFNDDEATDIRTRLKAFGRARFAADGVLKTSIEDITAAAGIAKGSFYKFFPSKELLFFDLLEEAQNEIRARLTDDAPAPSKRSRKAFEKALWSVFERICENPLIQFMGRESELISIMRKVPAERLQAHKQEDQAFLDGLIVSWNRHRKAPARDVVAARMSVLLLVGLNRRFLGERLFEPAAAAAVESLADCFFDPSPARAVKRQTSRSA